MFSTNVTSEYVVKGFAPLIAYRFLYAKNKNKVFSVSLLHQSVSVRLFRKAKKQQQKKTKMGSERRTDMGGTYVH